MRSFNTSNLASPIRTRSSSASVKRYRAEVLNAYLLRSLDQVREITDGWLRIYKEERPDLSLGRLAPSQFQRQLEDEQTSSCGLSACGGGLRSVLHLNCFFISPYCPVWTLPEGLGVLEAQFKS